MRTLGLFTPFALEPGGGERYLLSIAEAFRGDFETHVITPVRSSPEHVALLGRELDVRLDNITTLTLEEACDRPPFDFAIVMGNEVIPPIRPLGRRNYFLCQFPFPAERVELARRAPFWSGYERVVVYSEYARLHVRKALAIIGAPRKPIHVIHPPVRAVSVRDTSRVPGMILSVGRFFSTAHSKRQDTLIDVFRDVHGPQRSLHLAGTLHDSKESQDMFDMCLLLAKDLPVTFYPNATRKKLGELYALSDCYWHGTGLHADPESEPEKFEHFGITVVEAMGAGCIPFVLDHGGPTAIVTSGKDGWIYRDASELAELTSRFLATTGSEVVAQMRARARETARNFRFDVFRTAWKDLLER